MVKFFVEAHNSPCRKPSGPKSGALAPYPYRILRFTVVYCVLLSSQTYICMYHIKVCTRARGHSKYVRGPGHPGHIYIGLMEFRVLAKAPYISVLALCDMRIFNSITRRAGASAAKKGLALLSIEHEAIEDEKKNSHFSLHFLEYALLMDGFFGNLVLCNQSG